MHDSIIILLSFSTLFIYIQPWMAAQQSIFVKHVKIVCVQVSIICVGTFTTKQQFKHLHCIVYYDKNLGRRQFWHALQNYCWAAIPDPIWTTNVPYERKINMLSSTDNNNFMIFLFDFERFRIESWILVSFFFFFSHTEINKFQWCKQIQ